MIRKKKTAKILCTRHDKTGGDDDLKSQGKKKNREVTEEKKKSNWTD